MLKRGFFKSFAGTSIALIIISILGKGIGLIRESVFAAYFGLQNDYDLYLVGAVVPIVINTIIQYFAQNYFIPSHKSLPPSSRSKFFNDTIKIFAVASVIISIVLFFGKEILMNFYLDSPNSDITQIASKVLMIFALSIPLNALTAVISSYYQVNGDFLEPAISQLIFGITILISVLLLFSKMGIFAIPIGFVLGNLVQFIFLLPRVINQFKKIIIEFNIDLNLLKVIPSGLGLVLFIEIIGQLFLIVDRYFLHDVQTGGISALNYATNIYALPIAIISLTIATVIFPKLSDNFHTEIKVFYDNLFKSIALNTHLFIPLTLILFFFGEDVIKVLYYRGKFSIADVSLTFEILKLLSLSLTFFSAFAIINKAMYAIRKLRFLLFTNIAVFGFKIISSRILVEYLQQDGLALSTSLSYILITIICLSYLMHQNRGESKFWWRDISTSLLNGVFSVLVVMIIMKGFSFTYWISLLVKPGLLIAVYTINSILIQQQSLHHLRFAILGKR